MMISHGCVTVRIRSIAQISHKTTTGVGVMKQTEVIVDNRNPVIQVIDRVRCGETFEVVNMPKCEQKWFYNEDGEYVRCD